VASTANDYLSSGLLHYGNESDVINEIDVREESDLPIGETTLYAKKSTVEGRRGDAIDGGEKIGSVLGPEGADLQAASIAKHLDRRIFGGFHHPENLPCITWSLCFPLVQLAGSTGLVACIRRADWSISRASRCGHDAFGFGNKEDGG